MTSSPLKCLSIQQPWAHLIIHGGKDIENRTWPTPFRGWFLIHAGLKLDRNFTAEDCLESYDVELLSPADMPRGGIVGAARITDCVTASGSKWFAGRYGFTLADARPLTFQRCAGRLSFFSIPSEVDLEAVRAEAPEVFSQERMSS